MSPAFTVPQNVLVTGAFGNVGSSTIGHLLNAGHRVVATDLRSPHNERVATRFAGRVDIVWGDICEPALWQQALPGIDAIIHLAAVIPPLTERLPQLTQAVNLEATRELIRQMEASPTARRLVFASSMVVAGRDQHRRVPPLRIEEAPQPSDAYGRSKAEAEQALRASQLDWSILRLAVCPPTALSKKDIDNFSNIFDTSATGRVELVHTDDAGLAFSNAVACSGAIGRTLFIGGGERCRSEVLPFYNRMFEAMGLRPLDPRVLHPGPPRFFGDWVDTEESQRLLAFQRHSLDDILRELRSSLGPMRWLLKATAPVAGWFIARQSPHFSRN